ncbi:MAG: thioredoxin reductase [Miltoncostaeaceae bacterium]|nr:thioredoxin reductase [Miltoncostaeaceae bacterium]
MPDVHDLVIIGGGPAGLTAAIYAGRANLKPIVIEGFGAGGQLMLTTDVENYPGFPDGIQGPELMQMFRGQAERFGATTIQADVSRVDLSERPFGVWVDDEEYRAKAVIIATGASARWLGLESETRLRGFGVSTCATCDGFFFKDKPMVVVGGGDSAMEEAIYLARMASKVTIVHRRDQFRASAIMADRALANEKVAVRWNAAVEEAVGDGKVEAVRVRDTVTGELEDIPAAAMFVAIGHDPNTSLFVDQLELDEEGYVVTDGTRTSVEGVFACGDVQDVIYRQAITAAASGCMAAMDAERWLEAAEDVHTGGPTALTAKEER